MPSFRRKPAVVEATQWFPDRNVPGVCHATGDGCPRLPHVHTSHKGQVIALAPGDWVVAEPGGVGHYPIRATDLEALYEPSEGGDTVIPVDCRSHEGVTAGLVDAMFSIAQVLYRRSGWSHPAVRAALDDLRADTAARAVMGLPVPNQNPQGAEADPPC